MSGITIALGDPIGVISTLAGSLVLGLTSSFHCFLMCGPLACAGAGATADRGARVLAAGVYQGARLASYASVGAAVGLAGAGVAKAISISLAPVLPWAMVAALVASAAGLGKRLAPLPGVSRVVQFVGRASARLSSGARAGAIGALTPLLPCGLLYGVIAAAVTAGSAPGGALVLSGFALGGVPALVAAQLQMSWLRRLGPVPAAIVQRGVPLAAAAVIAWRAIAAATAPEACCH